jgi:hypothetical protein
MNNRLILTLMMVFSFTTVISQTKVSGGIYSNTTWTLAKSPYLMTNNIVVFPGATLTIEPGVIVRVMESKSVGSPYYLETRGSIVMVGTSSSPITFRADSATKTVGAWSGIKIKNSQGGQIRYNYVNMSNAINCFEYDANLPDLIELNQSTFSYNYFAVNVGLELKAEKCTFSHNENAIYGWSIFTFENCVFDSNLLAISAYASRLTMNNSIIQNNNMGIKFNAGALNGITIRNSLFENNLIGIDNANNGLIDSCTFTGNKEAVLNTTYLNISNSNFNFNSTALQIGFGSKVKDCSIERNETGVALGPINFGQPAPMIENNRICNNKYYNIDNRTDLNLFVPTNCFCSTDSAQIENKIFDGYDDISKGLISYAVFDTTCVKVLSMVNKTQLTASDNSLNTLNKVSVYPNPMNSELFIDNVNRFNSFKIISLQGQQVINGELNEGNNRIDVSSIKAGSYLLILEGLGIQNQVIRILHL